MAEAVIVATARTPIARAFKGSLVDVRPDDLGSLVVETVLAQAPAVAPGDVEDVIFGVAGQHGEQSVNVARNIALLAGLPDTVAGVTVARQCASSLQALRMAFHAVKAGEASVLVAGGVESVSRAGDGGGAGEPNPRFLDPDRPDYRGERYVTMGETAERVADQYGVSRERMDEFAKLSQDRAAAAQASGFFEQEITPVPLPDGGLFAVDEAPRAGTTLEKLASLPPAFRSDGRVTAGNSCPLNDGAAAVLVMDEDRARALGLQPLARILASSVSGCAPGLMGVGPIEAVRKLLDRTGMAIGDVDLVELNEAFAAQVLPVCDELGISIEDQLNPYGGAIALGHPFGMTGARMTTTLIHGLQERDQTVGLATLCIGGGMGMALAVERLA